ncbi:hypothetical protein A2U01_0000280 [Trifolium medium]|uniref:Uncharacterized protein n=1 Tax=Trifolium medium TaxID=97028 RepID=A0A392LX54_9FABA|nr:hypothetical protein [Trifolium medium]
MIITASTNKFIFEADKSTMMCYVKETVPSSTQLIDTHLYIFPQRRQTVTGQKINFHWWCSKSSFNSHRSLESHRILASMRRLMDFCVDERQKCRGRLENEILMVAVNVGGVCHLGWLVGKVKQDE